MQHPPCWFSGAGLLGVNFNEQRSRLSHALPGRLVPSGHSLIAPESTFRTCWELAPPGPNTCGYCGMSDVVRRKRLVRIQFDRGTSIHRVPFALILVRSCDEGTLSFAFSLAVSSSNPRLFIGRPADASGGESYPPFPGASYPAVHHTRKHKCGGRDLNSRVICMTSRVSSVAGYCPGPG